MAVVETLLSHDHCIGKTLSTHVMYICI